MRSVRTALSTLSLVALVVLALAFMSVGTMQFAVDLVEEGYSAATDHERARAYPAAQPAPLASSPRASQRPAADFVASRVRP